MAWRISDHVIRGEIDNRVRGRVTGRIWFTGRDAPVELDLQGNAWRDLAGRRLEFVNSAPTPGLPQALAPRQTGVVGDITASRKVKVPDIPLEEIGEYYARRQPWPWHWGNCLYLEWFSPTNGRIVIESATFQLTVWPEFSWDMSDDEELAQRRANASGLEEFMDALGDASRRAPPHETPESDDDAASFDESLQTEEEAERMLADSDQLADRVSGRMDREGEDADFATILEEELERRRQERGEKPPTPEEEEAREERIEEMNRIAAEAAADPMPHENTEEEHPLAIRAHDLALRLMQEPEENGWITDATPEEHPVAELTNCALRAAAKLAGALDGREWPPAIEDCALAIAWLKRARSRLADAHAAAQACADDHLVDAVWLTGISGELSSLTAEADAIIADLRAQLNRGFE